ncbi:MAG: Mg-protoporphyrin IX methyl transferase [Candidatus Accumulibacter appositus]|uniref:Mg-protoporphyrin IX methyl transferase n=1 Tax=Candidatus Accumulibacter appositus TaxID=1454003 RepID=A0A011NT94_9PROT|nr:class I SAM-dependent methyltransferase [Accumulibacter sp.]EXI78551.1 MAG: Mg-protoporphyrin IX methyl transferase [Candidatus Accumulibacter appositus]HRF03588.1 class I SAM-dependent methyltransferase [Accumulibacter sp.]
MQTVIDYRGKTKYDVRTTLAYKDRPARQQFAEMALLDQASALLLPKSQRVLDLPCGGGRVSVHLARWGYQMSAADHSVAMPQIARQSLAGNGIDCPLEQQDIEQMTYADVQFDTIVCFRLFHHFPTSDIRQKAVSELCRVAGNQVVISYSSPYSASSFARRLRARCGGRKSQKSTTPLAEGETYSEGRASA